MPTYKGWRWRALKKGTRYRVQVMVATDSHCVVLGGAASSKADAERKAKTWIDRQKVAAPNTRGCAWPRAGDETELF